MRLTHNRPRRRASTIVEAAMVLMVMMLFIFGIVEYCRFIFLLQVCENAARDGARYATARTGDGTTKEQVQAEVTAKMAGRQFELPDFAVDVDNVDPATGTVISPNWNDAPFGGAIRVRVRGTYSPLLPSFLQTQTAIQIRATTTMSSEAN